MRVLPAHRQSEPTSRGQALVELAIIMPILALLLVIAIDFGRVFYTYIGVGNAAREGAAYVAANFPDTANYYRTQAKAELGLAPGDTSVTVTHTCAPSPCSRSIGTTVAGQHKITVRVSTDFGLLTPLASSAVGPLTIAQDATGVIP